MRPKTRESMTGGLSVLICACDCGCMQVSGGPWVCAGGARSQEGLPHHERLRRPLTGDQTVAVMYLVYYIWDSRRPSASRVPCAFPSLSFFYTPLTHLSLSLVLCVGDRYGGPVVVGESAKDLPPLPRLLLARGAHPGNATRMILCIKTCD